MESPDSPSPYLTLEATHAGVGWVWDQDNSLPRVVGAACSLLYIGDAAFLG